MMRRRSKAAKGAMEGRAIGEKAAQKHVRVVAVCLSPCLFMYERGCLHACVTAYINARVCVRVLELFLDAASPSCEQRVYEEPRGIVRVPADRESPASPRYVTAPPPSVPLSSSVPPPVPANHNLGRPANMPWNSLPAISATSEQVKLKVMPPFGKAYRLKTVK